MRRGEEWYRVRRVSQGWNEKYRKLEGVREVVVVGKGEDKYVKAEKVRRRKWIVGGGAGGSSLEEEKLKEVIGSRGRGGRVCVEYGRRGKVWVI